MSIESAVEAEESEDDASSSRGLVRTCGGGRGASLVFSLILGRARKRSDILVINSSIPDVHRYNDQIGGCGCLTLYMKSDTARTRLVKSEFEQEQSMIAQNCKATYYNNEVRGVMRVL